MTKVIKFYANWCGPCKLYSKSWDKVVDELKDQIEFVEVDVEKDTTGLAAQYKINGIPHTVVLRNDGTTDEKGGRLSVEQLREFILK